MGYTAFGIKKEAMVSTTILSRWSRTYLKKEIHGKFYIQYFCLLIL
jgi:hypothetical protein